MSKAPSHRLTQPRRARASCACVLARFVGPIGLALVLAAPAPAAALTLAGVSLPGSLKIGGDRLVPVSCGVRDTLWVDHYVAVLYVPRGARVEALLDPSRPAAVLLRMVETRYLPDEIPHKWLRALEQSAPPRQLSAMRRAYRRLSDGDRVLIEYVPQRGVTMRVNGRAIAHVQGRAVVDAILAPWADDKPIDRKLRELQDEHRCPVNEG